MGDKDQKKSMVFKTLIVLVILSVLTIMCGLWPLFLLIIIGGCIAIIRLPRHYPKTEEPVKTVPSKVETAKMPTEQDVKKLAYRVILRRITELVTAEYPEARWIWEAPNAKQMIECGENVFILLNRAGGYRKAQVIVRNLQVLGVEYQTAQLQTAQLNDASETEQEPERSDAEIRPEEQNENYELIAFEWVDAHIIELNERCNEAIGHGITELLLQADELPVSDSWPDICCELKRADIEEVTIVPEGIKINLLQ